MLSPHSTCLDAFYASEPVLGSKSHAAAKVANMGVATPRMSTPALNPAGYWPLAPNHALSLHPQQASVLHIAQGRVWVTVGEGVQARDAGYGDCFLEAGDAMEVLAGQRVVFESLDKVNPVYFEFLPLKMDLAGVNIASSATHLGVNVVPETASSIEDGIAQPWHDLRLALGLASSALTRLAVGLTWGSLLRMGRLGRELRGNVSHFLLRYSHE